MSKKSNLSKEQLKLAKDLKVKLAEQQLSDQLKTSKKSSNKTIFILAALLLVVLALALSFLDGSSKVAQIHQIDKSKLISYTNKANFTPPYSSSQKTLRHLRNILRFSLHKIHLKSPRHSFFSVNASLNTDSP